MQCLPESLEASLWQHNKFLICLAGLVTNDFIHVSTLNVIKRLPWIINFIEVFNITFAIYAENVEYNLIQMKGTSPQAESQANLDTYRIFSQLKLRRKE